MAGFAARCSGSDRQRRPLIAATGIVNQTALACAVPDVHDLADVFGDATASQAAPLPCSGMGEPIDEPGLHKAVGV